MCPQRSLQIGGVVEIGTKQNIVETVHVCELIAFVTHTQTLQTVQRRIDQQHDDIVDDFVAIAMRKFSIESHNSSIERDAAWLEPSVDQIIERFHGAVKLFLVSRQNARIVDNPSIDVVCRDHIRVLSR